MFAYCDIYIDVGILIVLYLFVSLYMFAFTIFLCVILECTEQPYIGARGISVGWTLMLEVSLLGLYMVLLCACACKYASVSIVLMHVRRRRVTMTTLIDGGRRERG